MTKVGTIYMPTYTSFAHKYIYVYIAIFLCTDFFQGESRLVHMNVDILGPLRTHTESAVGTDYQTNNSSHDFR